MSLPRVTYAICAAAALVGCGGAPSPGRVLRLQTSPSSLLQEHNAHAKNDRAGIVVDDPEELSGVWESPDGQGGAVGLQLMLTTAIPADRVTLQHAPQVWVSLDAMLYERRGAAPGQGEQNGFSDQRGAGPLQYQGRRLVLHWNGFDLDLQRGPGDTWNGRLHRLGFDHVVALRRPTMRANGVAEWFFGTWISGDQNFQTCLHLGREPDGTYVGWSDSLQQLGTVRYGPNVTRPAMAYERYGSVADVQLAGDGQVAVEMNVNNAMCCSLGFVGTRLPNGVMRAAWHGGQPGSIHAATMWRSVAAPGCFDAR